MSEYGTRSHNVSGGRSTTLPGIGRVPRDASPELKRYLEALQEIIEVRNGFRGDVRDRAITLRELIASGLAKDLESVPFDPNNPTGQNVGFQPTNPIPDSETPTTPTNLAVSAGFGVLKVSWTYPTNYTGHSHTDVFRGTSNNRANAVFIGLSEGAMFVDATVSASTQYYYWVRHVSVSGEDGSYAGPVNATLQPDVTVLLSTLTGAITSSQLVSSLSTAITNNTTSVTSLNGQYMVKIASATSGGGQHVAGFGLSNTAANGTPTSAFIIAADKFAVVNATNHGVGATNSPSTTNTPFIVTTSAETIDGVTIPVGVYIQDAFINSARITELLAGSVKADYVVADAFMSSPRIEAMQINMGTMNKGLTTSTTSRALASSGANSTFTVNTASPTPTYSAGDTLRCVPDANTAVYMDVRVVTFSGTTLTYKPVRTTGSGTFNAWKITHQNPAKWTISNPNTRNGNFSIDASGVMHCQGATIKRQSDGAVVFDATELNGTYIKNLSVDTASIANNAVTVPASIQHGTGSYITPQATETLVGTTALEVNFGTSVPSKVLILAYIDLDSVGTGGDFAAAGMRIRYNTTNSTQIAGSTLVNYVQTNDRKGAPPYLTIAFSTDGWTGARYFFLTIEVTGESASAAGWWRVEDANLTVFGVRK
tara:strand:+ start:921 stop:2882 length:1962 start_codon:yes stop_codon:yes gene_type:complete